VEHIVERDLKKRAVAGRQTMRERSTFSGRSHGYLMRDFARKDGASECCLDRVGWNHEDECETGMNRELREDPSPRFAAAITRDRQHRTAEYCGCDVVRMSFDVRAKLSETSLSEPQR
jgi:hypothetical protein